jgi:PAS domain S-box-containing protein
VDVNSRKSGPFQSQPSAADDVAPVSRAFNLLPHSNVDRLLVSRRFGLRLALTLTCCATAAGFGIVVLSRRSAVYVLALLALTAGSLVLGLWNRLRGNLHREVDSTTTASNLLAANEALLRQAEDKQNLYERLLNAISDVGIAVTIAEGDRFVFANNAFCELTGYTLDELLAKESVLATVAMAGDHDDLIRTRNQVSCGQASPRLKTTLLGKAGNSIPVEFSSKRIDVDGKEQRINVIRNVQTI